MLKWEEWGQHILTELKRLSDAVESQDLNATSIIKELSKINATMSSLKTEVRIKSGIWGLMGGMIPVLIGAGVYLIKQ